MAPRLDGFEPKTTGNRTQVVQRETRDDRATTAESRRVIEIKKEEDLAQPIELKIVWRNVAVFVMLHLGALYGVYLCFFAKWETLLFCEYSMKFRTHIKILLLITIIIIHYFLKAYILYIYGGLGITAGAHRLWAHRTYKAKLPLRILLAIFQTLAVQVNSCTTNRLFKLLKCLD